MTTKACPFCQPDRNCLLQETATARVMMSNPRLMKGHLLVMPRRHVEFPWELTTKELKEVFALVHRLQKQLSETLGTGCDLRQNYRPFIKQGRLKVDHVHFHLLPRKFEDELYEKSMTYEANIFKDLDEREAEEVRGLMSRVPSGLGH